MIKFMHKGTMKDSDDNNSSDSDDEDNKLAEEEMDTYPVDQDANYNVIAKHFISGITKNKNIDHSVVDLDDLQSIKLDNDDSEYADSQMSIGSGAKSQQSSLLSTNNTKRKKLNNTKSNTSNSSSSSSSSSGSSSYNNKKKKTVKNGVCSYNLLCFCILLCTFNRVFYAYNKAME